MTDIAKVLSSAVEAKKNGAKLTLDPEVVITLLDACASVSDRLSHAESFIQSISSIVTTGHETKDALINRIQNILATFTSKTNAQSLNALPIREELLKSLTILQHESDADAAEMARLHALNDQLKDQTQIIRWLLDHEIDVHFRRVGGQRVEACAPGCMPAIVFVNDHQPIEIALHQSIELAAIRAQDKRKRLRAPPW